MPIICDDDEDENAYCDSPCDALLIERKDSSHICSYCGREYLPNSVNKHKRKLSPDKNPYADTGPELVSMKDYANLQRKMPTVGETEEKMMASKKSGFSWTNVETYWPEGERTEQHSRW